ncbi:MAG TPA: RHS repeat-associated core domain-containing protein, partial [Burkholderiales bacterium]|nr:RHS repeat-associated core domain-containing protein [Burkholderiales bacterium]
MLKAITLGVRVLLVLLLLGEHAGAAESITYIHNDIAGSPISATDASGNLLWRESYRPYGDRIQNQAAAASNEQWFHGKSLDAETGLQYFGARYYDPVLGRFMSADPVTFDPGNIHSFNRYAYGNNNPYKYLDPDGRQSGPIPGLSRGVRYI